jgi:hypothetical protein
MAAMVLLFVEGGTGEWVDAVPGGGLMSSMGAERDELIGG